MAEIYISVDIEADGPIPGMYSMLSLGAAAYLPSGKLVDVFSINLEPLPGAYTHPETLQWWLKQPEAWEAATKDPVEAGTAMARFSSWVRNVSGGRKPVFVGYPTGFDFMFVYWYFMRFLDKSPFSFSALDIKTYAMAKLGTEFHKTVKRKFPKHWKSNHPHTHLALDDAIEQGELFINMLRELCKK